MYSKGLVIKRQIKWHQISYIYFVFQIYMTNVKIYSNTWNCKSFYSDSDFLCEYSVYLHL